MATASFQNYITNDALMSDDNSTNGARVTIANPMQQNMQQTEAFAKEQTTRNDSNNRLKKIINWICKK